MSHESKPVAAISAAEMEEFEASHPIWTRAFAREDREAMLAEDMFSGRSVVTLLFTIVTIGLTTMVLTVLMVF